MNGSANQKTLLLLRHAKSGWKKLNLTDHDRSLNKRGKKDAPKMGKVIKELDIVPDLIISSPAKRAMDTAKLVAENCKYKKNIEKNPLLYASTLENYIDVIHMVSDYYQKVLVVGHNPIIEELVIKFINRMEIIPTCTLVQLSLNIQSWKLLDELNYKDVNLIRILRPKEMDI
jgi:phosphohistidine phosphatase